MELAKIYERRCMSFSVNFGSSVFIFNFCVLGFLVLVTFFWASPTSDPAPPARRTSGIATSSIDVAANEFRSSYLRDAERPTRAPSLRTTRQRSQLKMHHKARRSGYVRTRWGAYSVSQTHYPDPLTGFMGWTPEGEGREGKEKDTHFCKQVAAADSIHMWYMVQCPQVIG